MILFSQPKLLQVPRKNSTIKNKKAAEAALFSLLLRDSYYFTT